MRKSIRRLRLRDGDIVVVRDWETAQALLKAARGMKGIPNCPIVTTHGSIHRLSREYLGKLLARTEPNGVGDARSAEVSSSER